MNKTQLAVREISDGLDAMKGKGQLTLPAHVSADKFLRTAKDALQRNPSIAETCSRTSIYFACADAARDGLVLDGREAALVPRKGQASYERMVWGILKMLRNSGQLASIAAEVVYDGDHFFRELGDDAKIIHQPPKLGEPRGEPVGVYAIARLTDGSVQREVMDRDQIEHVRAKGGARRGPWDTDWTEMARKTVLKRIAKYLPSSTEIDRLMSADEGEIVDAAPAPGAPVQEAEPEPARARPARAKAAMSRKNKAAAAAPAAPDADEAEVVPEPGPLLEPQGADGPPDAEDGDPGVEIPC